MVVLKSEKASGLLKKKRVLVPFAGVAVNFSMGRLSERRGFLLIIRTHTVIIIPSESVSHE